MKGELLARGQGCLRRGTPRAPQALARLRFQPVALLGWANCMPAGALAPSLLSPLLLQGGMCCHRQLGADPGGKGRPPHPLLAARSEL